jgi:hypothetical protein
MIGLTVEWERSKAKKTMKNSVAEIEWSGLSTVDRRQF